MTQLRCLAWPLGVLITLSGCSTTSPTGGRQIPRGLAGDLPHYEAPAAAPSLSEPTGDLTLRDALSMALMHNPALAADSWEMRAREAETVQAGRRRNPELALELENVAGSGSFSGVDGVETTLALSQVIELGGKRAKRAEEARLDLDLAAWDYEVRRIDVLTETAAAFVEVLAGQERIALADTLVAVAEEVLASVSRRVTAGGVSPVEERRARVAVETSRVDRDHTVRALGAARARLGASWGNARPAFRRAIGTLDLRSDGAVPSLESMVELLAGSPQIARWATELDRRRATRESTRSAGAPDLELGGGIRHFNETGDAALVLGITVPLNLFDRNRDAVDAAESRLQKAREEQRDATGRMHRALVDAHGALDAAAAEAVALRDRILPEAESVFRDSHQAYQRGRFRLTDVLDAQRSTFELRGRYVDALTAYHILVAEIERLLGTPLAEGKITEGNR